MRFLSLVFISVLMLSACSSNTEATEEAAVVNEDVVADAESTLAVNGMVCSMGCVSAIQNELRNLDGVAFAAVNYEDSIATIKYDSKIVNESALIAAIEGIGDHAYGATPVVTGASDEEIMETVELMEAVETVVNH